MDAFLSTSFFIYINVFIYTYICGYKHMYMQTYILRMLSLQQISTRNNCILGKMKTAEVL